MSVRSLPVGAEVVAGGVHFRIWAPRRQRLEVVLDGGDAHPLAREEGGYFAGLVPGIGAGARYLLRLDGERTIPDPASRYQPEGPEGASEVVDPSTFAWSDTAWRGPLREGQVYYELHVGTFTPEGTYAAAAEKLPLLHELGVTAVELMPLAEFAGAFGWGYDGVDLFAPFHHYGRPDDLRALVDRAHGLGIAVLLDVVYNHFGPRGCFLRELSASYFTDRYDNEWGDAIDYDGPAAAPVRELVLANVEHWIREYHLDGLRLDATQQIFDRSAEHLVAAIVRTARRAAAGRHVLVVAENEPQEAFYVRPTERGGYDADGLWNDDFHHAARVNATGLREAYLSPYQGSARELLAASRWGFLYQGQYYPWQAKRRGTPALDVEPCRFVHYLENHDQVANSARGLRLHQLAGPGRLRALTALLLLGPQTPLLFQGQEWASSRPFTYFADHPDELAAAVRQGRMEFLRQFSSLEDPAWERVFADPEARATFEACKLDWEERERNAAALALHRDLLRLRREDPVLRRGCRPGAVEGALLDEPSFLLRFFADDGMDRLLLVNLGPARDLAAASEPLLAPPAGARWEVAWSSEAFAYGGNGMPAVLDRDDGGWLLPGEAAVLLAPARAAEATTDGEEVER